MRLAQVCLSVLLAASVTTPATGQGFEFPVQLIGFPVIIIAVRIANFIKKLTYALNPNTYRSRPRRGIPAPLDPAEVEKKLVAEMGEKVCIYEEVCSQYALQSLQPEEDVHLDWEEIFRKFSSSPKDKAEFYLLSVFLGDIVGSPELCRQLGKRGRSCAGNVPYSLDQHLATASSPSAQHFTTDSSPSIQHFTTASSPSAQHFTTASSPSVHHFTTASSSSVRHFTTASSPSAHHFTTASSPSVNHFTTAYSPSVQHITTASSPAVQHVTTASSLATHHHGSAHRFHVTSSPPPIVISVRSSPQPFFLPMVPQLGFTPQR